MSIAHSDGKPRQHHVNVHLSYHFYLAARRINTNLYRSLTHSRQKQAFQFLLFKLFNFRVAGVLPH